MDERYYFISSKLRLATLDRLTALILRAYGKDGAAAQYSAPNNNK